jgi:hypothetical protein
MEKVDYYAFSDKYKNNKYKNVEKKIRYLAKNMHLEYQSNPIDRLIKYDSYYHCYYHYYFNLHFNLLFVPIYIINCSLK